MAKPMPITVYGAVTPLRSSLRATGVLPTADVQILGNGQMIGHAVAQNPGELLLPLLSRASTNVRIAFRLTSKPNRHQ